MKLKAQLRAPLDRTVTLSRLIVNGPAAFYEEANLVIEFAEKKNKTEAQLAKLEELTVSGITRGQQIEKYNHRRKEMLAKKDINVITIDYSLFETDDKKNLIRDKNEDVGLLKKILKQYIK